MGFRNYDFLCKQDMGTPFDFFDPRSWPEYSKMTVKQRANRMLLQTVMEKHGFKPYPKE